MTVLAVDTSARRRLVALLVNRDGTTPAAEVRNDASVGVVLPRVLVSLLSHALEAVVVVTGPGSYTGLRAGMASALGVAQGRRVPLHGVGSLDVVAAGWNPRDGARGVVAIDAGRGFIYAASCQAGAGRFVLDAPRRVPLQSAALAGTTVATTDDLALPGLMRIDPARALAAAVPVALALPPLAEHGLAARYVP